MESVFEIVAEPNRRAILSLLVSSEQSVGEIERQLRMPQPTVSKHLRVPPRREFWGAPDCPVWGQARMLEASRLLTREGMGPSLFWMAGGKAGRMRRLLWFAWEVNFPRDQSVYVIDNDVFIA
jgi:DNA-binding transcriptional ArsR family regulator